ncbi:MAG: hypothetical protein JHD07_08795 [Bradyrhizobium sp.]|uniref:hypothetical protein n=1 Tax=Bradyrhizobium sp. TaxID=376 RepID=UPI001A1C4064|nr:hypothetical protein [Bradyrhizobium sp.]MBJ7403375.1 hypothetical protein [Bradyrhizobium sp.]
MKRFHEKASQTVKLNIWNPFNQRARTLSIAAVKNGKNRKGSDRPRDCADAFPTIEMAGEKNGGKGVMSGPRQEGVCG